MGGGGERAPAVVMGSRWGTKPTYTCGPLEDLKLLFKKSPADKYVLCGPSMSPMSPSIIAAFHCYYKFSKQIVGSTGRNCISQGCN